MKALLILGGPLKSSGALRKAIQHSDLIVAADGGAINALKLGLKPHFVVGDMDSTPSFVLKKLKGIKLLRYPMKKDVSDGCLALKVLLSHHPSEVVILGTMGGRPDHSLSALSLLTQIPSHIPAKMVSHDFEIFYTKKGLTFQGKKGKIVSLLPLHEGGAVVQTSGLLYPLKKERLQYGSHGLSNEMTGKIVKIQVLKGSLYVFHQF